MSEANPAGPPTMNPPPAVLHQYAAVPWHGMQFLGNRGGFSGARLWRLESTAGTFCLKAWPADDLTLERLTSIHRLLAVACQNGVGYLPCVQATNSGQSVVVHEDRLWDLSTWLPGVADFHADPSPARLSAAGRALARLHHVWQNVGPRIGPCPVVQRRLETLRRWQQLLAGGWRPSIADDDPVRPCAIRAWELLPAAVQAAERSLAVWRELPLPLHPCWCDPWHDHVLFSSDRVTGLIDYGSVKEDHAAVDLARLLGSFVGDDASAREIVLAAYRSIRPLSDRECLLIAVLEQAGLVNAVVTWLRWLYHDGRVFENRRAVANRLQSMVTRLDNQKCLMAVSTNEVR